MKAGADLRHRDALAREILWRLQAGGIGVVAGEIADQGIAGLLAAHAADHLQRALAGEIVETGGERGDAEIDIARGGRHRDRLRRVEEFQFDIEPGFAEIALVLRDEHRRRRRQPQHADLGLQRVVGPRDRRAAPDRQAGPPAQAAANFVIRPPPRFSRVTLHRYYSPSGTLWSRPMKAPCCFKRLLQLFNRNVARNCVARQRQRRGGAGRLPHRKAGAGDPRRRLAVMGHRGAAAGHQQIVDAFGHQHAIRQFVEAARFRDRRKLEDHVAGDMRSIGQPLTPMESSNEAQPSTSSPDSM